MDVRRLSVTGIMLALAPLAAAFSTGPPIMRTGNQADGGIDCTACHRTFAPANSDPRGRVFIQTVADYRPGVKQTIKIRIEHPEQSRWGFQLTARLASNPAAKAGTFTAATGIRVQCAGGAPEGNCGANLEFASHNATFVQAQAGFGEYEVEWTPPAAGSGEVVFYFAGNAANFGAGSQGDYIYTGSTRIGEEGGCQLTARPTITTLRNAASGEPGPVSYNSLVTLVGTGFQAPGRVSDALEYLNGRTFVNKLGCIAVEIDGTRSPITYAQFNQINAQVPTTTRVGTVQARVIANPGQPNELRSDTVDITLAPTSPAFFRLLPTPCIAARFSETGEITGDPSLLSFVRGAKPGDLLTLYATGLGPTNPVWQAGEIAGGPARVSGLSLEWNGREMAAADILYAGLAGDAITGLQQINIRVPNSGVSFNAQNEIRIRVGGVLSPAGTTIFISPN